MNSIIEQQLRATSPMQTFTKNKRRLQDLGMLNMPLSRYSCKSIGLERFVLKTYAGSCHCGAIRFEADIDLSLGTNKCNCSICTKTRNWNVLIRPNAFRLLSGEQDLKDYQFNQKVGHHLFCERCGIRPFATGHVKEIGGDYVAVQLAALDNVDPTELIAAPVRFANGRNNDWGSVPAETRHL